MLTESAVKWLGKDAVTPLAVDGKGGRAELHEKVAQWVAARGRNVTQPGTFSEYSRICQIDNNACISDDRVLRDTAYAFSLLDSVHHRTFVV